MLGISVGSTGTTRWDDVLGLGQNQPILAKSKQRVGQANSVGPITYLGGTEDIATGNREFASPSR